MSDAAPPASLAIVFADARRDHVDVGVGDQLEVAERIVRRELVARERAAQGIALELADEHRRAAQRGNDAVAGRSACCWASARRRTAWPAAVARRTSSSALYAAMPPLTPSRMRAMPRL